MSVLLETSAGELVIDLFVEEAPLATKNFIKLCKIKYYHGCLFFNVQANYIAQVGDPTGTGRGGMSVYGHMYGDQATTFNDEIVPSRKLNKVGLVCMANTGPNTNKSQFFITMRGDDLQHLEGKHTVFGEVAEGLDILSVINNLFCDETGRPYQDLRIKHTHILDDPFPDPAQLEVPPSSPIRERPEEELVNRRIPFEESLDTVAGERTEAELEQSIKRKEALSRAIVLEMTGDIPDAEVKPPDEVLFVCKLNPVTTDEDLELIFSRFGKITKCEIIRDFKTGDSLNYAFIEFETEASCIEAYEKMNNVLIDDRRIKVDFSQSVTKLWNKYLLKPTTNKSGSSAAGNPHVSVPLHKIGASRSSAQTPKINSGSSISNSQQNRNNLPMSSVEKNAIRNSVASSRQDYHCHPRDRSRSAERKRSRDRDSRKDDRHHRERSRSRERDSRKDDRHRRERSRSRERDSRKDDRHRRERSRSRERDSRKDDKKSKR
jgi:peptidyl-prolyl cis-trans isomerase-like 4